MELFTKLFGRKNDIIGIAARRQVAQDIMNGAKALNMLSFHIQVGDDNGNNNDCFFIKTEIENNPDVNFLMNESLLKKHTAKNLISIGILKVIIIQKSGNNYLAKLSEYAK